MAIIKFPSTNLADENGLLAIGGDLEIESLLLAYNKGIFPWPISEKYPLTWFAPPKRCLIFVNEIKFSEGFRKFLKKTEYLISVNRSFPEVIKHCAKVKRNKSKGGTWITKEMISAYINLHQAGYAHSIECYDDETLIGGLYGVAIGGAFSAESMFHLKPNASQLCLYFLAESLREKKLDWFDCQVSNPHLKKLGAKEIARKDFQKLLNTATKKKVKIF